MLIYYVSSIALGGIMPEMRFAVAALIFPSFVGIQTFYPLKLAYDYSRGEFRMQLKSSSEHSALLYLIRCFAEFDERQTRQIEYFNY
jgi:hypothetical protein